MKIQEIEKWGKKVQIDKEMKIISDIKAILDIYHSRGYYILWEGEEVIDFVEKAVGKMQSKKINKITAIIRKYYEDVGRAEKDGVWLLKKNYPSVEILIHKIWKYVTKLEIPANYLVISKLKYESFLEGK